jgi:hypothetical protein
MASIVSCRKDRLEQNPKTQFNYIPPDYPKKPSGRYLKSIYVEDPGMGLSGTKVEFEYDKKNYVQSYIFRGFDNNDIAGITLLEYDIMGNAIRIKLLNSDSSFLRYDDIEYDIHGRFTKISTYEKSDENEIFELSYFNEYFYPSADSIIEYRYIRYYNFEMPHKTVFLLDSVGNVFQQINFNFEAEYPYSSNEYYFANNRRIFDHHGLPKYYVSIIGFSLKEILSSNTLTGYQYFTYQNDNMKIPLGDTAFIYFEYDNLGFPVSRGNIYFYHYDAFE